MASPVITPPYLESAPRLATAVALALAALFVVAACSESPAQESPTASVIGDAPAVGTHISQAEIDAGNVGLSRLITHGELLFTAQFNTLDGAGRPETTGVGDSPFRERQEFPDNFNRISGPDANSCSACHNLPRTGGAGDNITNVFVDAENISFVNFEGGEGDGFKDLTLKTVGLERNSVGLFGSGIIEMLAREMTFDLQAARDGALKEARETGTEITVALTTKGVDFGSITVRPDGTIDTAAVEGVDGDLIIKPFHQKGAIVSLREFAVKASNSHHGMQATERFRDGIDADGDGYPDELSRGDLTALVAFMATLPPPGQVMPSDQEARDAAMRGEQLFAEIGCTVCHRQTLRLDSPFFTEPNPFNPPGKLKLSDVSQPLSIDLASEGPGPFLALEEDGSMLVPAFTDLKRHDMGPALDNETMEQNGIPTEEWLTRKLWGVGSEAPFLHHGRATLISEAILLHGGEALAQRMAYEDLSSEDQAAVVEFIKTLQILPEDATALVIDPVAGAGEGPGVVEMSVMAGILGGTSAVLTVVVALAVARRRRGGSS